jgi:uncharacterized protein
MKPNPGGLLRVDEIVGREALAKHLVEALEQQSIVLTAERRTGKTHVLEKLRSIAPPSWVVVKRDIGAVRTPTEFVQLVMADLYPHLEAKTNFRNWLQTIGEQVGGAQIGPVKLPNFSSKHWKQVLADAIQHVNGNQSISRVVFLWDEFPWMLEAISKTAPGDAMELLDTLRALRQQPGTQLRMVLTGSLGLHHVIRVLKQHGYNNTPVNDMRHVEVRPLDPQHSTSLARRLMSDSGITVETDDLYSVLAESVDHIPYYIHHVVSNLLKDGSRNLPLSAQSIRAAVDEGIYSADNPWDLQHYEDRTLDYYGARRAACLTLLDAVAAAKEPISIPHLVRIGKGSHSDMDDQEWLELTRLLERDHYFVKTETNSVSFKFKVVRTWWVRHRNLDHAEN